MFGLATPSPAATLTGAPTRLRLPRAARPREGGPLADHGHPRPKFHRALETGSLILAELGARECGHLSLDEALRLTALVALHDRDRGERYALRWLSRYLAERPAATLDERDDRRHLPRRAGRSRHEPALLALRDTAGRATSPRR